MAAAAPEQQSPPPASEAAAGAAAAEEEEQPAKKGSPKKVPITDGEKNLQRLREERLHQKKKLAEIRASTKKAKRDVAKLNKKASRVSLDELVQISMVKFRSLKNAGLLDEEQEASVEASSSSDPAPDKVLSIVAAHAKKQKSSKGSAE